MNGFDEFGGVDDAEIRRQRAVARDLRKTRWWQRKTASGECYYCGAKVTFKNITMDHIVPLTRGGKSTRENLVPCCKTCNTAKKTMMPLEWQDYLDNLQQEKW